MPDKGKDHRPITGKDAPGPGNYDPNIDPIRKSAPNFSVSKQMRDKLSTSYSGPGASTYNITDTLTKTHSANWRIGTE